MLEKTGNITLTSAEKDAIQGGRIPERVASLWPEASLDELRLIASNTHHDGEEQ